MNSRVVAVCVLAVLGLAGFALIAVQRKTDRHFNTQSAINEAGLLIEACQAYRRHPESGGKYPTNLADVIRPPIRSDPFLEDSGRVLIDPWGNPFRYALVPNENGEPEPYVWAERVKDGKLTLIGAKGTAAGKTKLFGLPE
jgi:hypothetical protein